MYTIVLAAAVSMGTAAPAWGCHGCHGCYGCYGCSGYAFTYGCCGCWGYSGCYGCCGCYGCYGGPFLPSSYYYGCYGCWGARGCWGGYPVVQFYAPAVAYPVYPYTWSGGAVVAPGIASAPAAPGYYTAPVASQKAIVPPVSQNTATVVVHLPAEAKLFVDGVPCPLTSDTRSFATPSLQPGKQYTYTLRTEVVRDGRTQVEDRRVLLQAGQEVSVNFGGAPAAAAVAARQ